MLETRYLALGRSPVRTCGLPVIGLRGTPTALTIPVTDRGDRRIMACPLDGVFMNPPSRSSRTAVKLTDSTNRHLNMYALTATAAGVGLMALAQPAQAKIVYTPAHVNFSQHPGVTLDLNHDGIGDFILALGSRAESDFVSGYAAAYAPRSNNTDEIVATSARG